MHTHSGSRTLEHLHRTVVLLRFTAFQVSRAAAVPLSRCCCSLSRAAVPYLPLLNTNSCCYCFLSPAAAAPYLLLLPISRYCCSLSPAAAHFLPLFSISCCCCCSLSPAAAAVPYLSPAPPTSLLNSPNGSLNSEWELPSTIPAASSFVISCSDLGCLDCSVPLSPATSLHDTSASVCAQCIWAAHRVAFYGPAVQRIADQYMRIPYLGPAHPESGQALYNMLQQLLNETDEENFQVFQAVI